jgi:uncharacterized protein (TIGR01777 family)
VCTDLSARGHEVVVLTRRLRPGPHRQVVWDGRTLGAWAEELNGAAVINLAGELVDRRPTPVNIELLTASRVQPTRALSAAANTLEAPVPVWLQASTLAIYGDAGEALITEASPLAEGPPQMAGVARAWEAAAERVNAQRQVVLRTSIVLDRGTPALNRLAFLVRAGLGGRVGSGRQWFSWIHIEDWLAVLRWALEGSNSALTDDAAAAPAKGVVLATGPTPVRNTELMATMRQVLRRPPAPPTPAPLVRLGALVLRTDPALGLTGRRAVSTRLSEAGIMFRHADLRMALSDLLS